MSSDNVKFWQDKIDEYTRLLQKAEKNRDKKKYTKLIKQAQRKLNQAQRIAAKSDSGYYSAEAAAARSGAITSAISGITETAAGLLGLDSGGSDSAPMPRPAPDVPPSEDEPEGIMAQLEALPAIAKVGAAGAAVLAGYVLLNRK